MSHTRPTSRLRVVLTYVPITLGLCAMVYAFGFGIRSWDDVWDAFRPVAGPVLAPLVVAVFVAVLRLRVSRKTSDYKLGGDAYLARLLPELSRERSLPPSRRASGADDASLDRARDHAQLAQLHLSATPVPDLESVEELERLQAEAERRVSSSDLAKAARPLRRVAKQGRVIRRRVEIETKRDARRDDA